MENRIVVTGGSGFIGRNFLAYMLKRHPDYEFVNYSLKDINDFSFKNYKFIKGDICDFEHICNILKDIDCVFHLAGESNVERFAKDPLKSAKSNVLGTNNILESAKLNNVKKIVFTSTSAVYGDSMEKEFKESDWLKPENPYAGSKAAAEMIALSYYRAYGLPIIIVRPCNVFGPYQDLDRIIPRFITNLIKSKKIPLHSEGKTSRTYIYINDFCSALDFLFQKGVVGEIYNIGTKDEIQNINLAKKILKEFGKDESFIEFVPDRETNAKRSVIDFSKIRAIGWNPKIGFLEGLDKTIRWYKGNEYWWSERTP